MTGILDIGIVAPALILAGVLIRRLTPLGYLLASTMLVFASILGPNLTAGGISQVLANVITVGQAIAFTVPFVILALIAIWLMIRLFLSFSEVTPGRIMISYKKEERHERHSAN
jgi:hypothetical protein